MAISSGVEGGEVTEVSGGGVVGHSAGRFNGGAMTSCDDKCVTKIYEAGKTVNTIYEHC